MAELADKKQDRTEQQAVEQREENGPLARDLRLVPLEHEEDPGAREAEPHQDGRGDEPGSGDAGSRHGQPLASLPARRSGPSHRVLREAMGRGQPSNSDDNRSDSWRLVNSDLSNDKGAIWKRPRLDRRITGPRRGAGHMGGLSLSEKMDF